MKHVTANGLHPLYTLSSTKNIPKNKHLFLGIKVEAKGVKSNYFGEDLNSF